jgi:hypothetical protein
MSMIPHKYRMGWVVATILVMLAFPNKHSWAQG